MCNTCYSWSLHLQFKILSILFNITCIQQGPVRRPLWLIPRASWHCACLDHHTFNVDWDGNIRALSSSTAWGGVGLLCPRLSTQGPNHVWGGPGSHPWLWNGLPCSTCVPKVWETWPQNTKTGLRKNLMHGSKKFLTSLQFLAAWEQPCPIACCIKFPVWCSNLTTSRFY